MTKELVKDPMEEIVQLGHSYVSINQKLMLRYHKSCVLFYVIIDQWVLQDWNKVEKKFSFIF